MSAVCKPVKSKEEIEIKPNTNPFHCVLCNVTCTSQVQYDLHIGGKKHKGKETPVGENDDKNKVHCDICGIYCNTPEQMQTHISGKKHKKKENLKNNPPPPQVPRKKTKKYHAPNNHQPFPPQPPAPPQDIPKKPVNAIFPPASNNNRNFPLPAQDNVKPSSQSYSQGYAGQQSYNSHPNNSQPYNNSYNNNNYNYNGPNTSYQSGQGHGQFQQNGGYSSYQNTRKRPMGGSSFHHNKKPRYNYGGAQSQW